MTTVRHLLVVLLAAAPTLAAQDAGAALRRAATAYDSVRTLRAAFVQTVTNPMIGSPDTSRGWLFLRRPDRFAMRFTSPNGDRLVADSEWLWMYFPSTVANQVVRTPVPHAGPAGPNLFAQFVDRPLERYRATHVGSERLGGAPHDLIRLEPAAPDLPFRSAVIAIGRADGLIRMVELVEQSGLRRKLQLSQLVTNSPVPTAELTFSPPPGVRIVTQP